MGVLDKQLNDWNFISVLLVFFLVFSQQLHFSITKLLSHLKTQEDLDSDYEKQRFVITRDSFNACFFYFRVELFSRGASKMCSSVLGDLKWALPIHFCMISKAPSETRA